MTDPTRQLADADMANIFDDPAFNSVHFDSYANPDSPFDTSRYFNLSAADSPDYRPRTPSKSFLDQEPAGPFQPTQYPTRPHLPSRSAESSSQASSSESSVRRKRKTTSESPPSPTMAGSNVKQEMQANDGLDGDTAHNLQHFGRSLNNLSLEQEMMTQNMDMGNAFDFESAASSPGAIDAGINGFNPQAGMKDTVMRSGPPVRTVEPARFFLGSSGASPASAQANTAEGSPSMFPASNNIAAAPDVFRNNVWASTGQTPNWSNDYSNAFASPGALGLTPSPAPNERAVASSSSLTGTVDDGRIPLHIGAIPAKSRVETQINIRMTIDRLPPGVSNVHLPTHTIAKAKLLGKEVPSREECLELHTMLVCTSAMNNSRSRERALKKAAAQNNSDIQERGLLAGERKEPEELAEEDKPSNGGEVRICQNCINRERKRAARKKLKKEEEQAHWERYETERVIVFNTNEYKAWLEWQPSPPVKDSSLGTSSCDLYAPSETAMQITAPMRIACYCRHQNEKDGFQVIFTLKDFTGKVVAQAVSDSILITDDHKTHPLTAMQGPVWYEGRFPPVYTSSQSMVNIPSTMPHMIVSKSTGNLQGMGFGPNNGLHQGSSVHHVQPYASGTTSGTMTPKNLSRPASPTTLGQAGPSKKRKSSSSAHRRVPSGLTMTKVDTSQPLHSAGTVATPFSPSSNPSFTPNTDTSSFMGLPPSSRTSYHGQPQTPSEGAPFYRNLNRTASFDQNAVQAFYSAPNSAHPSRTASPVLHSGPNFAAYQRQQGRPSHFALAQQQNSASQSASMVEEQAAPIINKVVPGDGPTTGGIEVSIYGQNFAPGMEVVFGDRKATATTYWGEKALCCVLPPSSTLGPVHVAIAGRTGNKRLSGMNGMNPSQATFRYKPEQTDPRMMEMALRFYTLKVEGTENNWQAMAQRAADHWLSIAQGNPQDGMVGGNVPGAFPG